jgi:hypothetical protein
MRHVLKELMKNSECAEILPSHLITLPMMIATDFARTGRPVGALRSSESTARERSRPTMRTTATRLAMCTACLAVGFVINATIMWAIVVCTSNDRLFASHTRLEGWPACPPADWPESEQWLRFQSTGVQLDRGFAKPRPVFIPTGVRNPDYMVFTTLHVEVSRAGWPLYAFRWDRMYENRRYFPLEGQEQKQEYVHHVKAHWRRGLQLRSGKILPAAPMWVGALTNTVFYGTIVAGLWYFAGFGRRRYRRQRGRCIGCGYSLKGLRGDKCPECGMAFASGIP